MTHMVDQLPQYPCSKLKLDQFFLQWVTEHPDVITSLLEDAVAGKPLRGPAPIVTGFSPLSPSTAHAIFAATPPLSPSRPKSPRSPASPHRRVSVSSTLKRPPLNHLPQFFFPAGQPNDSAKQRFQDSVSKHFRDQPAGLDIDNFCVMAHAVGDLPRMVGRVLYNKLLASQEGQLVRQDTFIKWWTAHSMLSANTAKRVFDVLRQAHRQFLVYDDFQPFLDVVLRHHPGLEFLAETAEFQQKYAMTVIYRIFYSVNRSCNGRISLRELRRSDFLDALDMLDQEDDINKVLRYFSYEHFYVIYCKFWELDKDHDFLINKDELGGYGNFTLSEPILARIFEQAARRFKTPKPGLMSYEDFVWFILCEEDKTSEPALEYWFRCVDLDGDGVLSPRELWFFYEEQQKRLEALGQEVVHFPDLLCQLHDMLQPEVEGQYTLRDLKRMRPQSGLLFNALFSLHKFMTFENRDPFASRAEQLGELGGLSDWDKYAKTMYQTLAQEDDGPEEVVVETDEQLGNTWQEGDTHMADAADSRQGFGR